MRLFEEEIGAVVQYLMMLAAIIVGMLIILGGVVIEPPAAVMETINRLNARVTRLFGRRVPA